MVLSAGQTGLTFKGHSSTTTSKDLDTTSGQTDESTAASGRTIKWMAAGNSLGLMEDYMKVNISKTRSKVSAPFTGPMDASTSASGMQESKMAAAPSLLRTVNSERVSGAKESGSDGLMSDKCTY